MRRGDTLPLYISPFGCLVSCGWSFNWISFYLNRHNHHRHRHPSAQAGMTLSELPINLSRKKYRSPPLSPPPSSSLLTTASPSSMKTKNTMPSYNHHRNIFFLPRIWQNGSAAEPDLWICLKTVKEIKCTWVYIHTYTYLWVNMKKRKQKLERKRKSDDFD